MEYSGGENLFTSHFVIGTLLPNFKNIYCVEALNKWTHFKNEDWGMIKYHTDRTQYVSFLHIIELSDLELIIQDLVSQYKTSFTYGTKDDFLEHVFGYTLFDLKRIVSRDYTFYGTPPSIKKYEFYYYFEDSFNEFLDFAVPVKSSIDNYLQYYKKVIQMIESVDFDSEKLTPITISINKSFFKLIFEFNTKNAYKLGKEFNFDKFEQEYIYGTFWPIVDVHFFTDTKIKEFLKESKNEFVNRNKLFDLKIFIRNNLKELEYYLKEYIVCFEKGKYKEWEKVEGTYFYHLLLESEIKTPNHQTLLISDKNEVQIEIYFKQILILIDEFIQSENNTTSTISATKIKTPTLDEDVKNILELINPLNGRWNRTQILYDNDYEIFKSYVLEVFKNGFLAKELCQFPITGAPNQFISKTIHQVYSYSGKKHKASWVELIHLFKQFANTEPTTTSQKFSNYKGDYEMDLQKMITY